MYSHLATAFYSTPWAILPEKLRDIEAFLRLKVEGGSVAPEDVAAIAAARRQGDGVSMAGRVAVVPVFGVLAQRVGMIERASGGVSTEELGAMLDGLAADRGVKCICLVFDSPGGSVFGVPELADKIAGIAAEKKVYAVADSLAASAAYWLASQASELTVTPGGQVGSIGVIAAHEDRSERLKAKGIKTTLVTSSKYKGEGDSTLPLDDEARKEIQSKVDHYDGLFVEAVARGRGVTEAKVRSSFGQGRLVTAAEAKSRGMADRVGTLEATLRRLGAEDGPRAEADGGRIGARLAAAMARAAEL